MSRIVDEIEIYDEAEGLITNGKALDSTIPTTTGRFAPGCTLLGVDGRTYRNEGTTASPSWVDEDATSTSEIADGAITPAKLASTGAWAIKGDTVQIGNDAKTGYNKLTGHTKVDNRPTGGTSDDYALQIRSESAKTSGIHWGLDGETHLKADGTASIRGVQGVAVIDSTFTSSGGTLNGVYGQARIDGALSTSGFVAGVYGLIEASSAVTASHVASIWADSHQDNAVTGEHELLYLSNNGAASLDQVIYASGQAEALLHLNTAGGPALNYISDTAETGGSAKKIKILVEGVPYYINIYPGA